MNDMITTNSSFKLKDSINFNLLIALSSLTFDLVSLIYSIRFFLSKSKSKFFACNLYILSFDFNFNSPSDVVLKLTSIKIPVNWVGSSELLALVQASKNININIVLSFMI